MLGGGFFIRYTVTLPRNGIPRQFFVCNKARTLFLIKSVYKAMQRLHLSDILKNMHGRNARVKLARPAALLENLQVVMHRI
jgi:hypothetical protein